MDDLKSRLSDSIQFKLSFSLSVAILVIAVLAGVLSFVSAFDEAIELQDDLLREVARIIDLQNIPAIKPSSIKGAARADEELHLIIQIAGEQVPIMTDADTKSGFAKVMKFPNGLQTLEIDNVEYRVLLATLASGDRIAVAQDAKFRNEIARDGALRAVLPFLVFVPILIVIVSELVRKLFLPITEISKSIDQRAEQDFTSIDESQLPKEVRPFSVAINRLLARVNSTMDSQRRFVADAAHELRSPMTALSLQAERLAEAEMSDLARDRLSGLRKGIERGRNLLEQLLALAKAQSPSSTAESAASVQDVFRRVLEDLMPLAEAKRIDVGVVSTNDAAVMASELDMTMLIKNLIDNAIRYTPEGGRVDLSVGTYDGRACIQVKDSGPGIPLIERQRVFDRFSRILGSEQMGSGLGLSIVQAISVRIGAEIYLDFADRENQRGLSVVVVF